MVKDTSTQFEFPKQSLLSRFLWPSKSRICGELSKRQGQEWVAKLIGANSVSVVCVCVCVHSRMCMCACHLLFIMFTSMDAMATIIFVSRRTRHLLEGSYYSRYTYSHVILSACKEHGEPRQVDEVFCFDSIVRGHHV